MTKILLVEDDKSLREIYGVRLLAEGYEIVSAGDGEEALAVAIKERPQLIVSDVMMPKISGFDMLDILRSTSETKDIKVIMMTALSSEDQRARGESLGADRYLVKSQVGIEDVVRTVHDVLGDGVSAPQTAAQAFGTPAPSAIATPVAPHPAPTAPLPPIAPSPPAPTQPTSTLPQTLPPPIVSTPLTTVPTTPQVAMPSPVPQPEPLFSVSRSPSLGDRVIHPLSEQPQAVNIGNLMNQELNAASAPTTKPSAPPTPIVTRQPPAPPQR